MNITSRYSDIPEVVIDESKIPAPFLPLVPLAKEWSIGDDSELDEYISSVPDAKRRAFYEAFKPHFQGLQEWHDQCAHLVPQPDELVLFDMAANAAATVGSSL